MNVSLPGDSQELVTVADCTLHKAGSKSGSPAPSAPPKGVPANDGFPDAPKSNINFYELSFGTVCGLCAGVFVKKGAKALAFMLGGVFVLLQVS